MVKDVREFKEKRILKENLRKIVGEICGKSYIVSSKQPEGYLGDLESFDFEKRKSPDLFIYPDTFPRSGDTKNDILKKIDAINTQAIEVYVESETNILFKVPKGDDLGLKIAEVYEKKFGNDIITIETLPDDLDDFT